MITEDQYNEAVAIVKAYHQQVFNHQKENAVDVIAQINAATSPKEVRAIALCDLRKTVQDAAVRKLGCIK